MASVVVAGFATMDYVIQVDGVFMGRGTRLMREAAWPRAGGAALYASAALALVGIEAAPLTWVGDDADGDAYLAACREAGVLSDGVARLNSASSTRCLLIYQADGSYGCLLRPGPAALAPAQARLAAAAPWLVIAAGPPEILSRLLDAFPAAGRLAWIIKDDPACFPADLAARLADRADVIFCNAGERAGLEAGRQGARPSGQVLFETRGAEGVRVEAGGETFDLPVAPLAVADATGAGDTFAGGALAVLVAGGSPREAAQAGVAAAEALLRRRSAP
ncbi:carbohydrate kinase family protein [Caulobacter segnis]|uniref:PfkB domain protein n=2 Tax=Caulobacter segnis TaxID=88688 RepID=D5VK17_CAUST|nr:carbohydrate kinase family protein [Caulobacter segnis]ADG10840.1 PfkB domain protein [Caulobacter segnis ATCC 21756]AVQ02543.1 carbohydrate kinase family protein [Caulobacter segnis]